MKNYEHIYEVRIWSWKTNKLDFKNQRDSDSDKFQFRSSLELQQLTGTFTQPECVGRLANSLLSTANGLTSVEVYWLLLPSTRLEKEKRRLWQKSHGANILDNLPLNRCHFRVRVRNCELRNKKRSRNRTRVESWSGSVIGVPSIMCLAKSAT